MKLYHHPMSSNARKPMMLAHHLGLTVEPVFVNLGKGAQRDPTFLALNPAGAVPVLVDGDVVLPESNAILIYLAEAAGAAGEAVYPTDRGARAQVHRWLFWMANHLSPAVAGLTFENFLKALYGQGGPDPDRVAQSERFFRQHTAVLESHLAGRDWLVGDAVTLADFATVAPFMYREPAKLPLDDRPHLEAWLARVQALPAWQATEPPARG
ncbi:MAG: glutathione S-transferase family protein [Myxococcales bacterium]|nr:glutathione S-transferase family protein [Myxococcales bacterium]